MLGDSPVGLTLCILGECAIYQRLSKFVDVGEVCILGVSLNNVEGEVENASGSAAPPIVIPEPGADSLRYSASTNRIEAAVNLLAAGDSVDGFDTGVLKGTEQMGGSRRPMARTVREILNIAFTLGDHCWHAKTAVGGIAYSDEIPRAGHGCVDRVLSSEMLAANCQGCRNPRGAMGIVRHHSPCVVRVHRPLQSVWSLHRIREQRIDCEIDQGCGGRICSRPNLVQPSEGQADPRSTHE